MLTKSFMRLTQVATKMPTRQFSLLMPLATRPEMPADLKDMRETRKEIAELEQ
jgi:hypothetical protein